jgi:hypothetical protein
MNLRRRSVAKQSLINLILRVVLTVTSFPANLRFSREINQPLMPSDGLKKWKPLLMLVDAGLKIRCDSPLIPLKAKHISGGKLFLPPGAGRKQMKWVERNSRCS